MNSVAQPQLASWHFFAFVLCMAILGLVGHVIRGFVNPLPDRLSDSEMLDVVLSDGYSNFDRFFGVEYDDAGYYRLDSFKNLRLAVLAAVVGGCIPYLFFSGYAQQFASTANDAVAWLWDLFWRRLDNI